MQRTCSRRFGEPWVAMATEVKLPRLGQGMESGVIVKWLKSEGEKVEKGDVLYELETEKVTQEVEAEASGVLLKIAVQEGEASVGTTVAVIGEEGEEAPPEEDAAKAEEVEDEPEEEGTSGAAREAERERGRAASVESTDRAEAEEPTRADGRIKASPLARRIARERGIDLASLSGTGPEGRVVAEDVERAAAAAAAPAAAPPGEVEVQPLTSVRKTIARRLTEAWTAPVFHLYVPADMTRANELLAGLRELGSEPKVTMTDVLVRVAAAALMRNRQVNAHFVDDEIHVFPTANVGIAVAAPSGLIVPVIQSSERKTIAEIAGERSDLVERARGGKLKREDLEGGTFTISNLGMFGIERFTAVLNPPQAAIVAVGATVDRAVVEEGEIVVRPQMDLMLTCDHRTIDGATGADFLRDFKRFLEQPALAL
jgi:pyruvate dehydrogenase E2 component (dihydrolipoamide acetyltransferase)